ncbi:putative SOS response-associated peptidase YedK [Paenibacillus rhizosphaerae]|uniref:Abasic site processing protein n=1 Tax=Paenibacillus rhizosphaerae TaxID=297318 RepID=A0A839TMD7_9BACL|nr:SOS response-associated peptidase [Paenibacillus rhizosphaerae]MBB3128034.1 putative SOS response-associated peptidase YedK [Paenibacillus rhizosphaerae]
MCQRFSMAAELPEVQEHFQIERVMYYYKNRYNISPTQHTPVVLQQDGARILDEFRWGFIPYWGKDAINADLRNVHQNPSYRKMVDKQRCVIPCNGFYYWKREGKKSYPVRVVMKNRGMFGVAGLYEIWRDTRGEPLRTCTLVMTDANPLIGEFDTRMPAILSPGDMERWLDERTMDLDVLDPILRTHSAEEMHAYAVTPLIDNDTHDTEECIQEMNLERAWVKR